MKNMRKRLKIKNIIIAILVITIIIVGGIKYINYKNSNYYKLKEIGYSKSEINIIEKKLDNNKVSKVINMDYSDKLTDIIQEKYFIFSNLNNYINYYNNNKSMDLDKLITKINTNTDKDFYTDIKDADISKGNLILVNKYYKLKDDYIPDDLINMSLQYAYNGNKIRSEVYEHYVDMCNAAKSTNNFILITTSSYRDYATQEGLYNSYKSANGTKKADAYSARPGYSEHQTGLTLDIVSYNSNMDSFEDTDEYIWLKDNSYKYGFILRYPLDKEDITGYDFEPWHYRYVGVEVASYIHQNNITFDEYYAYFIENK